MQAFALDSKAARRRLKELEGPRMRNDIQQKVISKSMLKCVLDRTARRRAGA